LIISPRTEQLVGVADCGDGPVRISLAGNQTGGVVIGSGRGLRARAILRVNHHAGGQGMGDSVASVGVKDKPESFRKPKAPLYGTGALG